MLIFKFYFSFLYIIELELHSSPVMLVGKVSIISNIQGTICKETRPGRFGSDRVAEPRCHSSDSKDSTFPTRSGSLRLDCSEGLGLGFEIHIYVTLQDTNCAAGVYGTIVKENTYSIPYCTLGFNFFLIQCNALKISFLRWHV